MTATPEQVNASAPLVDFLVKLYHSGKITTISPVTEAKLRQEKGDLFFRQYRTKRREAASVLDALTTIVAASDRILPDGRAIGKGGSVLRMARLISNRVSRSGEFDNTDISEDLAVILPAIGEYVQTYFAGRETGLPEGWRVEMLTRHKAAEALMRIISDAPNGARAAGIRSCMANYYHDNSRGYFHGESPLVRFFTAAETDDVALAVMYDDEDRIVSRRMAWRQPSGGFMFDRIYTDDDLVSESRVLGLWTIMVTRLGGPDSHDSRSQAENITIAGRFTSAPYFDTYKWGFFEYEGAIRLSTQQSPEHPHSFLGTNGQYLDHAAVCPICGAESTNAGGTWVEPDSPRSPSAGEVCAVCRQTHERYDVYAGNDRISGYARAEDFVTASIFDGERVRVPLCHAVELGRLPGDTPVYGVRIDSGDSDEEAIAYWVRNASRSYHYASPPHPVLDRPDIDMEAYELSVPFIEAHAASLTSRDRRAAALSSLYRHFRLALEAARMAEAEAASGDGQITMAVPAVSPTVQQLAEMIADDYIF